MVLGLVGYLNAIFQHPYLVIAHSPVVHRLFERQPVCQRFCSQLSGFLVADTVAVGEIEADLMDGRAALVVGEPPIDATDIGNTAGLHTVIRAAAAVAGSVGAGVGVIVESAERTVVTNDHVAARGLRRVAKRRQIFHGRLVRDSRTRLRGWLGCGVEQASHLQPHRHTAREQRSHQQQHQDCAIGPATDRTIAASSAAAVDAADPVSVVRGLIEIVEAGRADGIELLDGFVEVDLVTTCRCDAMRCDVT